MKPEDRLMLAAMFFLQVMTACLVLFHIWSVPLK